MVYRRNLIKKMNRACEMIRAYNSTMIQSGIKEIPDNYNNEIAKIAKKVKIDYGLVLNAAVKDFHERKGENA